MAVTHLTESQMLRAADAALDGAERAWSDAHLAACAACRALVADQRAAQKLLAARPIAPTRDLAAAVRATLAAERPWIEQLNWRVWTLRFAPVAAALLLAAGFLMSAANSAANSAALSADNAATASSGSAVVNGSGATVASALWNGGVSDDQLLTLLLRARPDDALSTYVQEK